jgi:hypothetical protein
MIHRGIPVFAILVLAVLALLAARHIPTAAQPQVLRTQAVEIVDGAGRIRITLDAFGGRPALWLYDTKHQRRVGMTLRPGEVPEVVLIDARGSPRLMLRAGAERAAEVHITDALGRPRITLSVDYRDDPGLWMYDRLARPRIGLKVNAGDPRLWLFEDPSGRVIFAAP